MPRGTDSVCVNAKCEHVRCIPNTLLLMRSLVTPIFLHACESWTLTAELQRRTQVMEMRCHRKILRISYKDHVTNEEVCAKIQQAIGLHEDLLPIVKKTQTAAVWSCLPFISSGQNHLARYNGRGEDDKADRGRSGKTTVGNGQAWSSLSPRRQWRAGKNGGNWLRNHLWCPNDPRRSGIDEMRET